MDSIEITLANGESIRLKKEDLIIEAVPKPGYEVIERDGYTVAILTTVTPELADEGLARDFTHLIQTARKMAGFSYDMPVKIYYTVPVDPEGVAENLNRVLTNRVLLETIKKETNTETIATGLVKKVGFLYKGELGRAVIILKLVG